MSPKTKKAVSKNKDKEFECLDKACIFKMKKNNFKTPEDKVEDLKKAIRDLGYNVEDTEEGIKITE